jgi:hypothetical protein
VRAKRLSQGLPLAAEGLHSALPPKDSQDVLVKQPEIIKLQTFLQRKFKNNTIDVRPRPKLDDSVEVFIGDESIGLIHVDDEDGDRSYIFNMSILDIDLEDL